MLHDKADGIAAAAAAKAFIKLLSGRYRKGGGLLVVKGAEAQVLGAPFLQFYKAAHHGYDVEPAEYLLYGVGGDQTDKIGQASYY
jgi:hypothetical protein